MKPISDPKDLFKSQAASGRRPEMAGRLIFQIEIPGRLPSWNQLLAMEHWKRHKFKMALIDEFISALQASADDCSMKTTLQKNFTLTACATLVRYRETLRAKRLLKSAKKRLERKTLSLFASKS